MISFYKKILKYIALISPQTVIVERYLIVARKTEFKFIDIFVSKRYLLER